MTAVEEPVDCPNVSGIACKYASIFQEFLQQSQLPSWNRFKNTGFWRQLTVCIAVFRGSKSQKFNYKHSCCYATFELLIGCVYSAVETCLEVV